MRKKLVILFLLFSSFILPVAWAGEAIFSREEATEILLQAGVAYQPQLQRADLRLAGMSGGLTRAEGLVLVSRAFGSLPEPQGNNRRVGVFERSFADVPEWAKADIEKLCRAGLLSGYPDGQLRAGDLMTEKQLRTLIARVWSLYGHRVEDDFYTTSNKEWLDHAQIKAGESQTSTFKELVTENEQKIEQILGDVEKKNKRTAKEQKVLTFYRSALAQEARDRAKMQPLQSYWDGFAKAKNVQEVLAADSKLEAGTGWNVLLQFGVSPDAKESSKYALMHLGFQTGLDKQSYLSGDVKIKKMYQAYLTQLLILAGEEQAAASKAAAAVYEMERDLATATMDPEEYQDVKKIYNPYRVEKFAELYPTIDVRAILRNQHLEKAEQVIVCDLKLTEKTASYLQEKRLEVLKSYAKVHLLLQAAAYLSEDFRSAEEDFMAARYGISGKKSREKIALEITEKKMGDYLGEMYVTRHFTKAAKADVENMVTAFIKIYKERIEKLDWMQPATKQKAMQKLDKMRVKVGYPEVWPTVLDEVTIKSSAEGGSFFGNIAAINAAYSQREKEKLGKAVDKQEWYMDVYEVNAYYSPSGNEIVFPAGILQSPFYDLQAAEESNLGGIGMVIAHEITHAFDNNGAAYDENGNMHNWWTKEDLEQFMAKCQVVIAFYDGVEVAPGIACNGRLTVSENVADLGGLSCSLAVLQEKSAADKKRYFENYARIWRNTGSRELMTYLQRNDVHALGKLRVNRALMNIPEFYEAYGIQAGDGMFIAPEKRVGIW